ncbi:FAD-dependent monooxygenase [Sinomonas sp. JGH33]|uniref:FAD-dependent monooxygenase n=1 Tax=Sinomonas terricola TaxID=3110330 RepID=A0ABU5T7F1_9MICC|nr:FAD-dependent oxidoreductase [Sinomonas sp. JGH33]MEA5455046.1 FAD-dependent monooxygenase [Sinomonas sp. JGH33]
MSHLPPTQPTAPTAVVIGGGIGGVAAALRLRQQGTKVTLVEQAPEFGEVGAGLQLAPNATRLLAEWGLLDRVLSVAVAPKNLVFRDAVTGRELLRKDVQGEFAERYGAPYIVAHRADLHTILVDAARGAGVELVNGVTVARAENLPTGARAVTTDGRAFDADAVIAADGLRSAVRAQMSDDEPIPSGYVAFRGALPISDVKHASDMEDVVVWLGPRCHLVQYPLRRGEMFNTVAVFQSPAFLRGEEVWGTEDELEEAYKDCVPEVRKALENLWRVRSWPMFDRLPLANWVDGNVALLGDAAHPMLQYLAQGACQALEDAHVLGGLVREHVLPADDGERREAWALALREYNEIREPRTSRVQTTARVWGESWHMDEPVAVLIRNMLFEAADARGAFPYTDWLYGQDGLNHPAQPVATSHPTHGHLLAGV